MEYVPLAPAALLRWDVVRRLLPPTPGRILEIGAGQGAFAAIISRQFSYLGFESDPLSFKIAESRLKAAPDARIRRESFSEDSAVDLSFDAVVGFEVLEHLQDDVGALKSWASRLGPDGRVIFSVPAHRSRYGCWDAQVGHERRYDRVDIERLLAGAGLVPDSIVCYGFPLTRLTEYARNRLCMNRQLISQGTSASGRMCQPNSPRAGALIRVAVWPFRYIQRAFLSREIGTGWVVAARRRP